MNKTPDFVKRNLVEEEVVENIYKYPRRAFLLHYLIGILFLFILPIVIIYVEIKVRRTYFVSTDQRFIRIFDFISRDFVDTRYQDIVNTYSYQGLLGRILGIGSIFLSTSGTDRVEVKVGPLVEYTDCLNHINSKRTLKRV